MFYSHEILTSRQYGVATIWLVATIGSKSSTKKVTRKAIQDVEIQKACEKIIAPGVPIALRLQGSLLYGVSRVYNQQCSYMLMDAQKIQSHMFTFFRNFGANALDPEAGKSRRQNLMLGDDPDFVPNIVLPEFNPNDFLLRPSTQKTSSQMSPPSFLSGGSSYSGRKGFPIQLDLQHSDSSDPRGSPYGLQGLSSGQKPTPMPNDFKIFGEEELIGDDWGLETDEFGNIIERDGPIIGQDEPGLPAMPSIEDELNAGKPVDQPQVDEQGDIFMMDEPALPDAEALPSRRQQGSDQLASGQKVNPPAASARRQRRRIIHFDEETQVSRNEIRAWQDDYHKNCCTPKRRETTGAQARTNAMLLIFGRGIQNVGQPLGVPGVVHPLAMQYSGDSLFTAVTGLSVSQQTRRKRARSASESIEDSEEERRVRPRLAEEGEQQGRSIDVDAEMVDLGQDAPPEVGREAQEIMSDHPSSAMPGNRGSSLLPGSSIRAGPTQTQFGREQPSSPTGNRGSVQDIVRYSDAANDFDLGAGDLGSADTPSSGNPPGAPLTTQQPAESQATFAALDREGRNFLAFMEEMIAENGERRYDDDYERGRKWIAFDDVFVPSNTKRTAAAQAFYHVLGLVTKDKMIVEQDGTPNIPFGAIQVGLKTMRPGA